MATGKKLSARGHLVRSAAPHFILGPLYIYENNRTRKWKFGKLVDIHEH